jgi:hypothetical protein
MNRVIMGAGGLLIGVLGLSTAAASAQEPVGSAAESRVPRFSVEGAAGLQVHYSGSMQSIAFGFAPTRSLTLLVSAERSHVADRIEFYADGYASERGGTEQFLSAEVRYAFLPSKRMSPYVVGGTGRGISRPNVNEFFPDKKERSIQVLYYGGGVRIPVRSRLDAFVDGRIIVAMEAKSDYFGVRFPVRAGIACRF